MKDLQWSKIKNIGIWTILLATIAAVWTFQIGEAFLKDRFVQTISISAQIVAPAEEVSFRGANIDGRWYNPEYLNPIGNWSYNREAHIFTTNQSDEIMIQVPAAKEVALVFNMGPNQGSAEVKSGQTEVQYDFYYESDMEYGNSFILPGMSGKIIIHKVEAVFCAIAVFILFLAIAALYKKKCLLIDWNLVEKFFYLALIPISAVFLAYFSLSSSPRVPEVANFWGYDAAIFKGVSDAWLRGKIPYVGVYENKGPLIFLIYALGDIINPKWGVYLIQTVALTVSLIFAYKIGKFLTNIPKGMLISLCTLVFFALIIDEGALTEEFNLPFLMISTFYCIKYLEEPEEEHPPILAFFYGITFGVSLCLRVTNCIAVCVLVFCITVNLIRNKKYKNVVYNAISFIGGVIFIVLPFIIYFAINNALYDLLDGMLLFNFYYADEAIKHSLLEWKTICIYLIPVILTAILAFEQKMNVRVALIISAASICWMMGRSYLYPHYYICELPFVALAVGYFIKKERFLKLGKIERHSACYYIVVLTVLLCLVPHIGKAAMGKYAWINALHDQTVPPQYATAVIKQAELIPEADRDSVIAYNERPDWYILTNITSCFKYAVQQDGRSGISEKERLETEDFFQTKAAKWIAVKGSIANEKVSQVIRGNYIPVNSVHIEDGDYWLTLYKRK